MGFFQRIFRWGKSEVNSAMDSLEDPIKMTDQGIRDLESDLEKSIKALASVKASCITAKNDLEKARQDVTDYQNKAMTFVQAAEQGKISHEEGDRLATQCLEKKSQRSRDLPQLEANYTGFRVRYPSLKIPSRHSKARSTSGKTRLRCSRHVQR